MPGRCIVPRIESLLIFILQFLKENGSITLSRRVYTQYIIMKRFQKNLFEFSDVRLLMLSSICDFAIVNAIIGDTNYLFVCGFNESNYTILMDNLRSNNVINSFTSHNLENSGLIF
jgi:hypothetical protein